MSTRFSVFISYLFHPLLIPTYLLLILFSSDTYMAYVLSDSLKKIILLTVLVLTCLMPVLSSYLLLKRGGVQSMLMENKSERTLPFIFTILYYITCFYFLQKIPVPSFIRVLILGATCSIAVALIVNFFWKISVHMIGMGGLCGALYALSVVLYGNFQLEIIAAFILSGIVATARLQSQAHSPAQLYTGFTAGFICEFFFISYFIK